MVSGNAANCFDSIHIKIKKAAHAAFFIGKSAVDKANSMFTGIPAKLIKLFALPIEDKWLLLLAWYWLPLMHFRLRWFGLQSCLCLLGQGADEHRNITQPKVLGSSVYERACACERSVALASQYGVVAGTCLSRSLTVMRLLAYQRVAGSLRVGVRLGDGALDAHAWVEVADVPLGRQATYYYEVFSPL